MRSLLSLVAFLVLLLATTHASAARLASGPSNTCVHDARIDARAKSASPTKKSYVGGGTRVGPWLTGKEEDIEVGLTYFGARYYAPHLGRWASADPLTIHGLGSDLNPYAYVGGRVMRDVDPFGLEVPPSNAQDLQQHGNGDYSYVQPDGTISFENYGIDFNNSNSLADAHFREAFADRLNDALMGHQPGVDVPLPGGGYANQGDIGQATVNHIVEAATPGWAKFFKPAPVFKPKTDQRNKSGSIGRVIGTVIEVGGTAGLGALAGAGSAAAGGGGGGMTLFHGTDIASARGLAGGAPLDAAAAAARSSGASPGFYLATDAATAEHFALTRQPGGVLQYQFSKAALTQLRAAGARLGPITPGRNGFPVFPGQEFVVPPSAYELFNTLRASGQITVTPY